ncbi:dipeptide epimerase [Spirulina sp. CCNP1310]|uniref:dipeptide epimerase n=1 Tax=Spirulina sp. CCNP1310 TaxID=3110249 RepID=UPI002B2133B5|nr:dipeptide epimerase [Spirulina sp. CCNP1310]MEA5420131.1 dipeptide epimerase [Spirulina sp. CCNP1310]
MHLALTPFLLQKRVPLTISRGTTASNTNLWVRIEAEGIEGWGEATPFSVGEGQGLTTAALLQELTALIPLIQNYHPLERQKLAPLLAPLSTAARAAVDTALQDWCGKRAGLPLWQLWGLDLAPIPPTSVTIGLSDPATAAARVAQWQAQIGAKVFKVKLGSPQGIAADQAMFSAVQAAAPDGSFSVDANGGWDLEGAIAMAHWLADRGVQHLEQPLAASNRGDFAALYGRSPLPIFADESCFTAQDIPALASVVHGINIKLMKAQGLSEAQAMIHTAQSHNLRIMFGCYSDSTLANTAMSHLAPYADYIDLDSHLNLLNDPFQGATLDGAGRLIPPNRPGLGITANNPPPFDAPVAATPSSTHCDP